MHIKGEGRQTEEQTSRKVGRQVQTNRRAGRQAEVQINRKADGGAD